MRSARIKDSRLLKVIEGNEKLFGYIFAILFLLFNNTINATSYILESIRLGQNTQEYWKPIVWELTSAISSFILFPLLFHIFNKYPLNFKRIPLFILIHFGFSFLFSVFHVLIMVQMRQFIYFVNNQTYQFGNVFREFFYEYRKDVWAYIIFLIVYNLVTFSYSRLKGEAKAINTEHEDVDNIQKDLPPKHFIIKKLDTEFLIESANIEWMESSGNYVNLHVNNRVYPHRSTLSKTTDLLSSIGMCRIHKSHSVNCHQVDKVKYDKNGDGIVYLKSGATFKLSRTYNTRFKSTINCLKE